jgi:diguanylate cyclase (GGDEF)-like protein
MRRAAATISALSKEGALEFGRLFDTMMDRAYHWPLWGAAYVIHGGCSDDTFSDSRASLISRGRLAFERALSNPDMLADEAGDKVLVGMADVLRRFVRKDGPLVARYGGEEFAALMIGIGSDQAEQYAEEIRKACAAKEILIGESSERVTISIGFTVSRGDVELANMMRIADRALYTAKRRGRDRVVQADKRSLEIA